MKRSIRIVVVAVIVLGFISYTTFSAVWGPKQQKAYYPGKDMFHFGGVNFSPALNNSELRVHSGSDSAVLYFSYTGVLLWYDNTSMYAPGWFGHMGDFFDLSISYANTSISTPGMAFSFYLTNYSFHSSDPYILMPMHYQGYYPQGLTIQNNVVVTPSRGHELIAEGAIYNSTGIFGVHQFWVNFTIHPVLKFGPYYSSWTPIKMSISWFDNFTMLKKS